MIAAVLGRTVGDPRLRDDDERSLEQRLAVQRAGASAGGDVATPSPPFATPFSPLCEDFLL